jgi:hypothetical protein
MNKFLFTFLLSASAMLADAQQMPALTAKDYAHAESFLSYKTAPLIDNETVRPNWLPGDSFWYRNLNSAGSEFILVNPATKTVSAAFDQQKLAAALSKATGNKYEALMLPFQTFTFAAGGTCKAMRLFPIHRK